MECKLTNKIVRSANERGVCRRLRLDYLVTGAGSTANDNGAQIIRCVSEQAPHILENARRKKIEITRCAGNGTFEVSVEYEIPSVKQNSGKLIGDSIWSFDAAGGSTRVYSGMLIQSTSPSEQTAPDPGSSIYWNGRFGEESHIAGTEKVTPALRECCTVTYRASKVTTAFKRNIMNLTGCVNSAAFHGWEPGEVLFLGASSGPEYENENSVTLQDVSYRFAVRANRSSITVGGLKLGRVCGWDIPWEISQPDPRSRTKKTLGAYATRIYEFADLRRLAI